MRRILTRIVLLAVPLTLGCSSDGSQTSQDFQLLSPNCTSHLNFNIAMDSDKATPPIQLRIESCRLDVDACADLCSYEIAALQQSPVWSQYLQGGGGPVFNGDLGAPSGQPPNPGFGGLQPTSCKVSFDGSTANTQMAIDVPTFGSGCAIAGEGGVANGSSQGSGVGGL
jgi:hypothetical protein